MRAGRHLTLGKGRFRFGVEAEGIAGHQRRQRVAHIRRRLDEDHIGQLDALVERQTRIDERGHGWREQAGQSSTMLSR